MCWELSCYKAVSPGFSGELYLRQQLDYEVDKTLLLMVEACDSAPLAKCGKAVVNISVADVNDNSPAINIRTIGSSKAQVYISNTGLP